jgi:hypothetical protein
LAQLGYHDDPEQKFAFPDDPLWGRLLPGQKIAKGAPLFPRMEKDTVLKQ